MLLAAVPAAIGCRNICLQQDLSLQEDWMQQELVTRPDREDAIQGRNRARVHLRVGRVEATAEVDITSTGLLAIGALVSMILLSVPQSSARRKDDSRSLSRNVHISAEPAKARVQAFFVLAR